MINNIKPRANERFEALMEQVKEHLTEPEPSARWWMGFWDDNTRPTDILKGN